MHNCFLFLLADMLIFSPYSMFYFGLKTTVVCTMKQGLAFNVLLMNEVAVSAYVPIQQVQKWGLWLVVHLGEGKTDGGRKVL